MQAEDRAALISALRDNPCVVVLGHTGCGKTTQLPQLLLEAGFGPVCVTQPRRVAAIAAARRVAQERGGEVGGEVGYAIRFEQKSCASTRIKFVTDGVLLRDAITQPDLPHYGALVIDEAHERSLSTDVLLTIAKRILAGLRASGGRTPRGPQRLVVSSATMDASRFASFFYGAPVVVIASRSFPVRIHHVAKPLPSDTARLEAALEVVMRVHTQRPAGPDEDILLFLAGAEDIATATHAARRLGAALGWRAEPRSATCLDPV